MYHYADNEASPPPRVDWKSMPCIYKVFDKHSYAMDGHTEPSSFCYHCSSMPIIVKSQQKSSSVTAGLEMYHCTDDEASKPQGVNFASIRSNCKVFGNLHMSWMGIWSHHHSVITTGASPYLENLRRNHPGSLIGNKLYILTDDEASFTTTQNRIFIHVIAYTRFDNHHMQWIGIWSYHYSNFTKGAISYLENLSRNHPGSLIGNKLYN